MERKGGMSFYRFPGKIPGWGLDFARAVAHRPLWARILFWIALGKWGRHEFWGLVWAIQGCGLPAYDHLCEWKSSLPNMPLFWKGKQIWEEGDNDIQKEQICP